jgi:citrate synthase
VAPAILLDAVGLPRPLFTPMFAVGRTAGWCAHIAEQRAHGRLIRPASRYTGPVPEDRHAPNQGNVGFLPSGSGLIGT